MPEDSVAPRLRRDPPNVPARLGLLNEHEVRYVVTGSVAAMLHGVPVAPGDLDITPARDYANLVHLACVLGVIGARQYADAPFGDWEADTDGEQRWVQREPTQQDVAVRADWQPEPHNPASFDHLLESKYGAIDIVPEVSGTYEELMPRAEKLHLDGQTVWVEAISDLLATITVPRREKDRHRVEELRAIQRGRDC